MRVKVKPVKGAEIFLDDVELSNTVGELKTRIFEMMGEDYSITNQKLIFRGKVAPDDTSLEQLEYKDGESYFVLIVSKKKKPKAKPAAASTTTAPPAATTTTAAPQQPAQAAAAPVPVAQPAATIHVPPAALEAVMGMGFAEADARVALTAAFGDVSRAVQYLTNPEELEQARARLAQEAAAPAAPAAAPTPAANADPIEAFRASPAFEEIRRMVANNPRNIEAVLQRLQTENPALFQALSQDRETMARFIDMLSGEETDNAPAANTNPFADTAPATGAGGAPGLPDLGDMPQTPQAMIGQLMQLMSTLTPEQQEAFMQTMGLPPEARALLQGQGAVGGAGAPPPGNVIQLTRDEMNAVERLQELGFPRRACVEAYLACDKNEEIAANYLFTNATDIMQEDGPPPPPANPAPNQNQDDNQNNPGSSGGGNSMEEDPEQDI